MLIWDEDFESLNELLLDIINKYFDNLKLVEELPVNELAPEEKIKRLEHRLNVLKSLMYQDMKNNGLVAQSVEHSPVTGKVARS